MYQQEYRLLSVSELSPLRALAHYVSKVFKKKHNCIRTYIQNFSCHNPYRGALMYSEVV